MSIFINLTYSNLWVKLALTSDKEHLCFVPLKISIQENYKHRRRARAVDVTKMN
jgi:hypothetical protein